MALKQVSISQTASSNAGAIPIPLEGLITNGRIIVNGLLFPDSRTVVNLAVYFQEAPTGTGNTTIRLSNVTAGTSASVSVSAADNGAKAASVSLGFTNSDTFKVDITAVTGTFAGSTGTLFVR